MEASEDRVSGVVSSMIDHVSSIDGVSANEWLAALTTMKAMVIADCLPQDQSLDAILNLESQRLRFAVEHIMELNNRFGKSNLH